MKKNLQQSFVTVTYFLPGYKCDFALLIPMSKSNLFKVVQTSMVPTVVKFHMKHEQTEGFQNCKSGSSQLSTLMIETPGDLV